MRLQKSDSGRTKQSQKHIFPDDVAALVAKLQKVRDAGIPIIMTTGNHDYDIMDAAAFEEAYFGLLEPVDRIRLRSVIRPLWRMWFFSLWMTTP